MNRRTTAAACKDCKSTGQLLWRECSEPCPTCDGSGLVHPFAELDPPYSTIVVDPPWPYQVMGKDGKMRRIGGGGTGDNPPAPRYVDADGQLRSSGYTEHKKLPYSTMTLEDIKALPVGDLVVDGRCFMWVTNRYLRDAWDVLEAWGFDPQDRVLVWCKPPRGTMPVTTEYVLMGRKGSPQRMPWHGTTWFQWPHTGQHSAKPDAFMDLVESWCPGPYVELFCRRPRLGWDSWGYGYEIGESA